MKTENLVPCHPRHNAVSSISGFPRLHSDRAVLSFQIRVTVPILFFSSPSTEKTSPQHLVASDIFPSTATNWRNENKSENSLRSQREIADVLVSDYNMSCTQRKKEHLFYFLSQGSNQQLDE